MLRLRATATKTIALLIAPALLAAQEIDPAATNIDGPAPRIIDPVDAGNRTPPSDAIVLFDGTSTDEWEQAESGGPVQWRLADGVLTVRPGAEDIVTKREFGDVQLHIEWRVPADSTGSGQSWGNSGVYIQDRYEIQILNSYDNATYVNGQAGSVYKQHVPLVNASLPPGRWQSYDIVYTGPRFSDKGSVTTPAKVTVLHNGVLIQNDVSIWGPTVYRGLPRYEAHGKASLRLQSHASGGEVSFRNIWIREL